LDYGCGGGELVALARDEGVDLYGVDAFYAGSRAREIARNNGLLGNVVFGLGERGNIPFGDSTFDLVISNQVFEHVEDLNLVLAEITRVLKPGAQLLALFPAREVIREGHCGVPLIHWFPRQSGLRYPYMRLMRAFGLGYFKEGKTQEAWARDFIDWLDRFTVYRAYGEIKASFQKAGLAVRHIEEDYIGFRLGRLSLSRFASWSKSTAFRRHTQFACRRLGGLVIQATKVVDAS
jgi:SAM-dependent methyltransferase